MLDDKIFSIVVSNAHIILTDKITAGVTDGFPIIAANDVFIYRQ